MDVFATIVEILSSLMPRNKKEHVQSAARDLANYHTEGTLEQRLPNYMRLKTSHMFKAKMIKSGLWDPQEQFAESAGLSYEIEQLLKNVKALPDNCIEKLINQIKLRVLLELHPLTGREDLRQLTQQVEVKRDLERLKEMIRAENSFTNAIFKHFQEVQKAEGAKLLYEVKEIEKKLYHVNILQLKELCHEAADARKAVQDRRLILLASSATGLFQALFKVGADKPKTETETE